MTGSAAGLSPARSLQRPGALALVTLVATGLALALPGSAAAAGTSIESAPSMTPGVTYSGDTATEPVIAHDLQSDRACTKDEQLWKLTLAAGERVLLRGVTSTPASGFQVEAVPPGVTESELLGTATISGVEASSLTEGLSFAAGRSGSWLIVVGPGCSGGDGPYQLSATVTAPTFIAGAGGGGTIASAPLLTPAVTVSGNTAADPVIPDDLHSDAACTRDEELWKLNLLAGEQVLLKGQTEPPASAFQVEAIPPGVTEPELLGTSPISGVQAGSLSEGLSFAASRSGTWLILVGPGCSGGDGPYQFSATVVAPAFIAGAGGGATIVSAPLLGAGTTVSGNTASGAVIAHDLQSDRTCTKDEELWKLNLLSGDKVLLKGQTESPASGFQVEAVPPGVTEPQLLGTSPIAGVEAGALAEGLSFTAKRSGSWLVVVGPGCSGNDGPYELSTSLTPVLPKLSDPILGDARLGTGHDVSLRLTLSEAGSVVVSISEKLKGRRSDGHCQLHRRLGRPCSVAVHRLTLTFGAVRGHNTLTLGTASLGSGSYYATVTAIDALGRVSKAVSLAFHVVRHHR